MKKDRLSAFTDNELYLLHRHAIEAAASIINNNQSLYTKDEQQLHSILKSELSEGVISRARMNSSGTAVVRSKK